LVRIPARKIVVSVVFAAAGLLPGMGAHADPADRNAVDSVFGLNANASPLRDGVPASAFGIKLYSGADRDNGRAGDSHGGGGADVLRIYGDMSTPVTVIAPAMDPSSIESDAFRKSLNSFGIAWQHRLDSRDSVSLAAEYGTGYAAGLATGTEQTRTGVSWTTAWRGDFQPSLTGSVFLGDETARDDNYRYLGRRFVGLSVGGQMNLFSDHTPYVALQLRRSYYDSATLGDNSLLPARIDDRSLLSAGWRWQVQPNMSLEAGASYGLNASGQDLYNSERSRLFFGTKYNFH
jgi:hypothetical protein